MRTLAASLSAVALLLAVSSNSAFSAGSSSARKLRSGLQQLQAGAAAQSGAHDLQGSSEERVQDGSQQLEAFLSPAASKTRRRLLQASSGYQMADTQWLLPEVQMRRGISYVGSNTRLRKVVWDMMQGKRQVKVAVIGGSISWGQGASERGKTDWVSLLASWLNKTFPNVTVHNGCVPATSSVYMTVCLELSVSRDTDLVIAEYICNDGMPNGDPVSPNNRIRQFERLVRRVLALPSHPALILMQYFMPTTDTGWHRPRNPFHHTMEDLQDSLAHYYDFPTLSLRTATWRMDANNAPGLTFKDIYWGDAVHPADRGHKVMGDLAIYLLRQTALDLQARSGFTADEAALLEEYTHLPPMYADNEVPSVSFCAYDTDFPQLVSGKEGFDFIDEGRPGKPKRGFVALQPGAWLSIKLNTVRTADRKAAIPVSVGYLKSYHGMGHASVACASGCSCESVTIDAHHTEHTSVIFLYPLQVAQAESCEIKVTVLSSTTSGGHKFKVVGVMAAADVDHAPRLDIFTNGNAGFGAAGHFSQLNAHVNPDENKAPPAHL